MHRLWALGPGRCRRALLWDHRPWEAARQPASLRHLAEKPQRSLVFPNGGVCLLGFTPPLGAASTSRLFPGEPGSAVPTAHLRWAPLSDCGPPGLQLLTEENKRPRPSRLCGLSPSSGPCFLLFQRKKRFCSSSALELGFQGPLHTRPVSVVNYEGRERGRGSEPSPARSLGAGSRSPLPTPWPPIATFSPPFFTERLRDSESGAALREDRASDTE